jgi:hypothetical protein
MRGPKPSKLPISNEGKLAVTKIDAATRQLETAITLWFFDGDPVSISTLCFAATEILEVLNKTHKGPPTPYEQMLEDVKPEYREDFKQLPRDTANFLKHGRKDPHATHFLAVGALHLDLFNAVQIYSDLNFGKRPILQTFRIWLGVAYPKMFPSSIASEKAQLIASAGKQAFFQNSLPMVTKTLAGV